MNGCPKNGQNVEESDPEINSGQAQQKTKGFQKTCYKKVSQKFLCITQH